MSGQIDKMSDQNEDLKGDMPFTKFNSDETTKYIYFQELYTNKILTD